MFEARKSRILAENVVIFLALCCSSLIAGDDLATHIAAIEGRAFSQMMEASKGRDSTALRRIATEQYRSLRQIADRYSERNWSDLSDRDIALLSELYVRARRFDLAIKLSIEQQHREAVAVKLNRSMIRSHLFLGEYAQAGKSLQRLEGSGEGPLGDLNDSVAHAHASVKEWSSALTFSARSIEHLVWSIDGQPETVGDIRMRVRLHAFITRSLFGRYSGDDLRDVEVRLIKRVDDRTPDSDGARERLKQLLYFELLFSSSLEIENPERELERILSRWVSHLTKCSQQLDARVTLVAVRRFVDVVEMEQKFLSQKKVPVTAHVKLVSDCTRDIATQSQECERARDVLLERCNAIVAELR